MPSRWQTVQLARSAWEHGIRPLVRSVAETVDRVVLGQILASVNAVDHEVEVDARGRVRVGIEPGTSRLIGCPGVVAEDAVLNVSAQIPVEDQVVVAGVALLAADDRPAGLRIAAAKLAARGVDVDDGVVRAEADSRAVDVDRCRAGFHADAPRAGRVRRQHVAVRGEGVVADVVRDEGSDGAPPCTVNACGPRSCE